MKRKIFLVFTLFVLILIILLNSCTCLKSAESYSTDLFNDKKDDFQKIADYLMNDTESNVIMIQKNKNVNPWNTAEYFSGVYWVSNDKDAVFDTSYAEFISRFLLNNKIDEITVLKDDSCVEFNIETIDVIAYSIVYTKTGNEPQSDQYLWKIKDLCENWYFAQEKDNPRNDVTT